MNAVEIEEAVSALADRPFDREEFPFAFLEAFGNKETTLKSDLGGVLQTNNIHIAVAASGEVTKTLAALKGSPATARAEAKFILATEGESRFRCTSYRLHLCRLPGSFRLLPAARGHDDRPADQRECLRHSGHEPKAIERIRDGTIVGYAYDPKTASLTLAA
jgi:hypothetical protein